MNDEIYQEIGEKCLSSLMKILPPNMCQEMLIKLWKIEPGNQRLKDELMHRIRYERISPMGMIELMEYCEKQIKK